MMTTEEQMMNSDFSLNPGAVFIPEPMPNIPDPNASDFSLSQEPAMSAPETNTNMFENTTNEPDVSSNGEDMLLAQIDAFRDKARELQELIRQKEVRVNQLEEDVSNKEVKIQELQGTLDVKQEAADSLVQGVERQITAAMEEMKESVAGQMHDGQEIAAEQSKSIRETLKTMTEGLEETKGELSEKVHSENVKLYRNIQDALKEADKSAEQDKILQKGFKSIKVGVGFCITLSVINLVGLAGIVVVMLKMIGLI